MSIEDAAPFVQATPPSVVLQPCGSIDAYRHYLDSIETPVPLETILPRVGNERDRIAGRLGDRVAVAVWGVSGTDRNRNLWDRIRPGDFAIFARNNEIFASATILDKVRAPDLAEFLWGSREWECVYFLDNIRPQHLPYSEFNSLLGYDAAYIIRDFRILDEQKSRAVAQVLHLNGAVVDSTQEDIPPPSAEKDFETGAEFLRDVLQRTLKEYLPAREQPLKDHPFAEWFRTLPKELKRELPETSAFEIDSSVGYSGNWAYVPWITMRRLELAPSVQSGLYVAYLFRSDMTAVYLSLLQGVTEAQSGSGGKLSVLREKAAKYREMIRVPSRLAISEIRLPPPRTTLAANYEAAHVWGIGYTLDDMPDPTTLRRDLDMMLSVYREIDPMIEAAPEEQGEIIIAKRDTPYTIEDLRRDTLWKETALQDLLRTLAPEDPTQAGKQVILTGPPGTGKTWVAQCVVRYLTGGIADLWRLVQFHPSFSYEQFIEGLRPQIVDGSIQFEIARGIVRRLADACANNTARHFLIIDEMNRANLPRVLGELMYLFEYRDREIQLPFSGSFRLPTNLGFLGTMNTADRSIRSIDLALRRRFDIFECPADRAILERYYANGSRHNEVDDLFEGFDALNMYLTTEIDRYHTIGQTFFMQPSFTPEKLRWVWEHQVCPTIAEYFFDEPKLAESITLGRFWKSLA